MGTEAKKYYRMHCDACRTEKGYALHEDFETEALLNEATKEHNEILHNGKKLTEKGFFVFQDNYWRFPL